MDSKAVLLMLVLGALLIVPQAMATSPTPGGGTVQYQNDNGIYPGSSAGTIDVTGGHIYLANITGNMSTYHWAGVYGNATGTLVLGDSSNNVMYTWNAVPNYLYFSTATINWATATISAGDCTSIDGSIIPSGSSDSCANTFKGTGTLNSNVLGTVSNVPEATTYDNTKNPTWNTLLLSDGSNPIFAAEVNSGGTAYDGSKVDYQVILPENEDKSNEGVTTYNIWIELY